jgi:hypothetical protein
MNNEDIHFPVFRKYKNNKSYFKILSFKQFEEVQLIGSKKIVNLTEALHFPEMLFIKDLIYNYAEMAEVINEAEYNSIL